MSGRAMVPLEQALVQLLDGVEALPGSEIVPLEKACGRVLATAQSAQLDVPPWDNSAMDGYAVRCADAGRALPVAARFAAGDAPGVLPDNAVARIFTGAPIPAGADAVVMQEDVTEEGARAQLPEALRTGQHIRPCGQDCRVGDALLPAGRRLRPQDIGLLASQGVATLPVKPCLRVALLSTGSELVEPGAETPAAGQIYNSNRPMLAAMLRSLGCDVIDLGRVEDSLAATQAVLRRAAEVADLVLSSGGVSVGEADHVRDAVESLGVIQLWKVAIKPGKPFAQGVVAGTPFIGLPGNPVSAFVTFLLLARPWILRRQGRQDGDGPGFRVLADFDVARRGSREEYLRVSLRRDDSGTWARPFDNQSSGVLRSVTASDALARVPAETLVERGDPCEILLLDSLLT